MMKEAAHKKEASSDFLTSLIQHDVEAGVYHRPINTRFPPEPNGYCISEAHMRFMLIRRLRSILTVYLIFVLTIRTRLRRI